ncbi:response regulator transcription factor [Microbacterium sp. No. 7]|uniref:response regulator transcription factor n=1 Tax=Microbacterium sp. No. 7 TaxID=1714373 RepID=UPI0006D21644|nr:response regulator transcription factor [Microbacterium sp. No. 7]ALJ20393.1 hypothetical protein AOA12_10920 [Microbacterium sp. No. 7]
MSATLTILELDVHGTPAGWRGGCRGAHCPAPVSCRDVYRRYSGDYGFRRRVDAGETPAQVIAEEIAEAAAVRERDREAARREKAQAAAAAREKTRKAEQRTRPPKREPKPQAPCPEPRATAIRDALTRLHADGRTDAEIADELDVARHTIAHARRKVGLPANRLTRETHPNLSPSPRVALHARVAELHAAGLNDLQIAEQVDKSRRAVAQIRRRLNLPAHPVPRSERAPRRERPDRLPDVVRLHGEGKTDRQIADELDITIGWAAELRRKAALPARRSVRSRWDGATLQPHGTNACHARGCRRPECIDAHRAWHRAYVARRRAEGPRQHHGTAYGYQLGCRTECPATPSCTDAMNAADTARRRAAGAPARELIDAAPVQAHMRDLMHAGLTVADIATASGLSFASTRKMIHSQGKARGIVSHVLAERAAAVLAVPLPEANP